MSTKAIEAEVSIRSGIDAEVEVGRGITVNVADVTLESLAVTENGQYVPGAGVDGYSDVTVRIPVYSGEVEVVPGDEDITLDTGGQIVPEDILIHGIPQVPHTVIAYGSFVKSGTSVTYTLDTHSTRWTRLLIKPHTFPHTGMAASAISRAIMTKYIDLELDAMITAYMSSAGTAYNAGSYKRISTGDECDVTNGVVTMTGESSTTGKWINGIQYDWYAWADGVEPEVKNYIEGEFETETAGVLTLDLPYSGDDYVQAIMIYDAEGIIKDEVPRAYTMTAYCAFKNNAQEPTYDGDTANNGYRYQIVYTGATTYTSTAGSPAYVCTQADPVLGVTNCIKMPDNHTLKVYVSNATAGTSVRFRVGMKYKYQVFYGGQMQ